MDDFPSFHDPMYLKHHHVFIYISILFEKGRELRNPNCSDYGNVNLFADGGNVLHWIYCVPYELVIILGFCFK